MEIRNSYDICPCCGCEYGYDDTEHHFEAWKEEDGMKWFDKSEKPTTWNAQEQFTHIIRPWPPYKESPRKPIVQ